MTKLLECSKHSEDVSWWVGKKVNGGGQGRGDREEAEGHGKLKQWLTKATASGLNFISPN